MRSLGRFYKYFLIFSLVGGLLFGNSSAAATEDVEKEKSWVSTLESSSLLQVGAALFVVLGIAGIKAMLSKPHEA